MTIVLETLEQIGLVSFTGFWVPLFVWTLGALPVYLVLGPMDRMPASLRYTAHQAMLMALPLTFLLIPVVRAALPSDLGPALFHLPAGDLSGLPLSTSVDSVDAGETGLHLIQLVGLLTIAAAAITAARLFLLLRQTQYLMSLRRYSRPVTDATVVTTVRELSSAVGLRRTVALLIGPDDTIPCTFGHSKPSIVIPRKLLDDHESLRLVLEHEVTHIRRADYLLSWLELITAAIFAIHPLVSRLQHRIAELRELCCDAAVLSRGHVPAGTYAHVILQFASGVRSAEVTTVAILHPTSNLKQRVDAMKNHPSTDSTRPITRRRWAIGILSLALTAVMAACSAELADKGEPGATSTVTGLNLHDAEQDLNRLQVQMEYLTEEMDKLRRELEKANGQGESVQMKPEFQRFHLLQSMYMQRLEAYETLRLERETDRRLGLVDDPGA